MIQNETQSFSVTVGKSISSKQRIANIAFWSIIIGLLVMGLKFVAWQLTGSVALYSDALESIVNAVAAMAAFWAIQISHKPADIDHQHGHHKAEYFSAVLEGVLIVIVALLIIFEVWRSWGQPMDTEQSWLGFGIHGTAAVINMLWASMLIRVGRAERSPAMIADGHHIMTDVMTSSGVLIGLVSAIITCWTILDQALAVIVALNILWQGWRVISPSMDGLMDRAVELDEHMRIRDIIAANSKNAIEVHDLKTRIAGRATFIEFHLVVDADMSVGASHLICERIEDALRDDIPSVRVIIHVEPDNEAKLLNGAVAVPFV